jgi:hypothetical protein
MRFKREIFTTEARDYAEGLLSIDDKSAYFSICDISEEKTTARIDSLWHDHYDFESEYSCCWFRIMKGDVMRGKIPSVLNRQVLYVDQVIDDSSDTSNSFESDEDSRNESVSEFDFDSNDEEMREERGSL